MDKKSLKKIVLFLSFLVPIAHGGEEALPSPSHFNFEIQSHSLRIEINPPSHVLKAEDKIEILLKEERAQVLSFLIHSKLGTTDNHLPIAGKEWAPVLCFLMGQTWISNVYGWGESRLHIESKRQKTG
jgi:hypothetical protein